MFEVGKQYVYQNDASRIMRVLALTEVSAVVTYDVIKNPAHVPVGKELLWKREDTEPYWKEYQQPRSINPRWFNIFESASNPAQIWMSNTGHGSRTLAEDYARKHIEAKLIDTIEITYTEKK